MKKPQTSKLKKAWAEGAKLRREAKALVKHDSFWMRYAAAWPNVDTIRLEALSEKLALDADLLWFNAVIEVHGKDIGFLWAGVSSHTKQVCLLSNGEVYGTDDAVSD